LELTRRIDMSTGTQPGQTPASSAGEAANLAAAIDRLWVRFLPEILERVGILEDAAVACTANQLSTAQVEAAHAAAHKLAGILGTFSLADGTELAREFELLFSNREPPPASLAGRLAQVASELRHLVDSRK
jgi:HPt (histidine-containing phosphotransfer) domain-containing protein